MYSRYFHCKIQIALAMTEKHDRYGKMMDNGSSFSSCIWNTISISLSKRGVPLICTSTYSVKH